MAHKKAGGSSKNGRDSNLGDRGIKAYGGEMVTATLLFAKLVVIFHAGKNVGTGRLHIIRSYRRKS